MGILNSDTIYIRQIKKQITKKYNKMYKKVFFIASCDTRHKLTNHKHQRRAK